MSDPAEALRAWRGFFVGCCTTIEIEPVVAAYLTDALTQAIDEIEAAQEMGRFMAFLADTEAGELSFGQADAVAAATRSGKVSVLAKYRMSLRRPIGGGAS